ncbi:hypothetical protein F4T82_15820 [Acinetobacter lwoffii]|nr:hypothetical protein [Acinetobacter lwoffii]
MFEFAGLCFLSNAYATSDEWTQRWKSSSARSNENLVQANLIELKESDHCCPTIFTRGSSFKLPLV